MQARIRIRPLVPGDYDAVLSLWMGSKGIEVAEGDDEASFTTFLERNPDLSPCAEVDRVIVGAALCGHDGRRGLIYHLAVSPEFRREGVGQQLVAACIEGLRAHGITRVIVLVAKDNPVAQQFWNGRGFEQIWNALPLGIDVL